MKPDKELDKVVAEVMGQKRIGDCPLGDNDCPGKYEPQIGRWPCLPPYSTDIAAAWEAWEWLGQNAPHIPTLRTYKDRPAVIFVQESWNWDEFIHAEVKAILTGESYAHAICKAILWVKDNGY